MSYLDLSNEEFDRAAIWDFAQLLSSFGHGNHHVILPPNWDHNTTEVGVFVDGETEEENRTWWHYRAGFCAGHWRGIVAHHDIEQEYWG